MSKTPRSPQDEVAEGKMTSQDLSFRHRALVEAARYGSDPWVFVRELLQNARDAGARRVEFETVVDDGMARVICRDDGAGMAYPHAQKYLFALYASSKEEEETQAGQFGIGFWSILRFRPSSIIVRSRRRQGKAWEVTLDGGLEGVRIVEDAESDLPHGTEIVLERPIDREILGDQVLRAARRHGRFLTQKPENGRRRGERELEVVVDGQRINEPFALPSPSVGFEGRGFRGVVGLGSEPSVELFAHGLFVRSAQSLDELLDGARRRRTGESTEDALAELPSLAPQVLLDSDEVELLLARSDARQNRHLTQLVRRAEKELARLVQRKLDSLSPQPWYRVWFGALRERLEFLEGRTLGVALAVGLFLGSVLGLGLARVWSDFRGGWFRGESPGLQETSNDFPVSSMGDMARGGNMEGNFVPRASGGRTTGRADSARQAPTSNQGGPTVTQSGIRPYRDLARSYRGPRVDPVDENDSVQAMPALRYQPAAQSLLLNALVVGDLASGRPAPVTDSEILPYAPTPCLEGCLTMEMLVEAEVGLLRLPIPTGHRLSVQEVRLGGLTFPVFETPQGEAVLRITSFIEGFMEYQTGPAPDPTVRVRPPLQTPAEVLAAAASLRQLPPQEQISGALQWVSERVVYSRSQHVVRDFAQANRTQETFLDAALEVGAGDCDVQNGLLTALLWELDLEARMVLGYVGNRGAVAPGLHAWVEVRGDHGRWQAIDASLESPIHPLDSAAPAAGGVVQGVPGEAQEMPMEGLEAASPTPTIPAKPWWQSPWWPLLLGLALAMAWLFIKTRRGRTKEVLDLGEGGDLAALLGGALRHPTAFAAMPAVFHGRFVPLMGGSDALSLHQARKLAEERRLFRSDGGGKLAQRAVRRGVPVVDGGTPEGAVLSRAFGAIDLDHWGELLGRCHETESSRRIAKQLRHLGESWRIQEAPELGEAAVEIALEDLRLGHRLVLIDLEHPDFAKVRPTAETAQGDFALLDLLTPRLELEPGDQSRVLSHFAAAALEEAAGMESRS